MRAGVLVVVTFLLAACWWVLRDGLDADVEAPAPVGARDAAVARGLPAVDGPAIPLPTWTPEAVQPALAASVPPASTTSTSGTPLAPPALRVEVVGIVLDAAGAPLAGADVWFLPSGRVLQAAGHEVPLTTPFIGLGRQGPELLMDVPLAALEHTLTDSDGRFAIGGPSDGSSESRDPYPAPALPQLVVHRPGHAVGVRTVVADGEPVELRLRAAARVTGRVVDEHDRPLASASVRVLDDFGFDREHRELSQDPAVLLGELHSAATGADGAFRLDGLWPGQVTLAVLSPGRVTQFADRVVATEGEATDAGVVALSPGRVIEGRVVDDRGRGVQGATAFTAKSEVTQTGRGCVISGLGPEDDSLPFELEAELRRDACRAVTDADGRFRIEGVGVPTVTVYARAPGFEAAKLRDVSAGGPPIVLALRPETVLEARVVERGTGRPVPEATLEARRVVGEHHDTAPLRVERSGDRFVVHGTGRLGTELRARAPGFAETTLRTPGPGLTGRQDFEVELLPGAALRGAVRVTDGSPVGSAEVALATAGQPYSPDVASARTDAAGAFVLAGLPAGEFELRVRAKGHPTPSPRAVTTRAGESQDGLDFTLEESATLEVVVHDLGEGVEAPRHGATLKRDGASEDERPRMAHSEANGRVVFRDLAAGAYRLEIKHVATRPVTLAAGEHQVLRLDLTPPRLDVRVLEGGRPAADLVVMARRFGQKYPDNRRSQPSDAEGRIAFDLVSPGRFELLVYRDEQRPGLDLAGASGPFTIEWGGRLELEVAIGTGRLAGRAMSSEGPVAGEEFFVKRAEGGSGVVRSDESGFFALDRLLPGTYSIVTNRCEHPGHLHVSEGPLVLSEGQSIEDVLLLIRWGARVTGSVHTPGGAAAPESAVVLVTGEGQETPAQQGPVALGRYALAGLAPGRYRICAHRSDRWERSHECPGAQTLEIADGSEQALDLVLADDG